MESKTIDFERRDSITLKMNTKGEYAYDAKIYYDSSLDEIYEIMTKLIDIDIRIHESFIN